MGYEVDRSPFGSCYLPQSEIERALAIEGISFPQVLADLRRQPVISDPTHALEGFGELVNRPTDYLAIKGTDFALGALEAIRKTGLEKGLLPWEKAYKDQNPGNPLRNIGQKEMMLDWLADAIFPARILHDLDYLRPGIYNLWHNYFREVAREMMYSPGRLILASLVSSGLDGLSTINTGAMAGVSVARLLTSSITSTLETMSEQVINRLAPNLIGGLLGSDIRLALENYKTTLNPDIVVQKILEGSLAEFTYRLSLIGTWSTWAGLSAGVSAASTIRDGPEGLKVGLATAVATASGIWGLGRYMTGNVLAQVSDDLARVQDELHNEQVEREQWGSVTPLVEFGKRLMGLLEKRYGSTKRKNIATAMTNRNTLNVASVLIGILTRELFQQGTLAGSLFMATRAFGEVAQLNMSSSTRRTKIANRDTRIGELEEVLAGIIHTGERGPLTDNDYSPVWRRQRCKTQEWDTDDLVLQFTQVGMPTFQNRRRTVEAVSFDDNFLARRGQILQVIGGNTSGKTTFLKVLAGLNRGKFEDTRILWNGEDIKRMSPQERKRRFIYLAIDYPNMPIRQAIAHILMNYRNRLTGTKFSAARIRDWTIHEREDKGLEEALLAYFHKDGDLPEMDSTWFRGNFTPSGYQRAMFYLGLHFAITEPVVLMYDEPEGTMSEYNFDKLLKYVDREAGRFPGLTIVGVSKILGDWYDLDKTVGIINMLADVSGREKSKVSKKELYELENLARLEDWFNAGKPMSIENFTFWVRTELLPLYLVSIPEDERTGRLHLEWEKSKYGIYLENILLPQWVNEVSSLGEAVELLHVCNLFYSTDLREYQLVSFRRAGGESPKEAVVKNRWKEELRSSMETVLGRFKQEAYESLRKPPAGRNINIREAALAQRFLTAYWRFHDYYTGEYPGKGPSDRPAYCINRVDYMGRIMDELADRTVSLQSLISDQIVLDFIAESGPDDYCTRVIRLESLDIIRQTDAKELGSLMSRLKIAAGVDFRGTSKTLWDILNAHGELDEAVKVKIADDDYV